LSFPEFKTRPWKQFLDCLKIEYPELTSEEQGIMGQLCRLCREYSKISLLDEEWLMEFKWWFMYIAQKCLKSPAITRNQELVKLFVRSFSRCPKCQIKHPGYPEGRCTRKELYGRPL